MMKKILACILAICMIVSLMACASTPSAPEAEQTPAAPEAEQVPEVDNQPAAPEEAPAEPMPEATPEQNESAQAPSNGQSPAQALKADFEAIMAATPDMSAFDIASQICMNPILVISPMAMEIEPGFLNGFTEEITGFESGALFAPMIGTIPFIGYVFQVADGADVDAFVASLEAAADLRWNICTSADEMVCTAVGNTVFFVMSPASFEA